jgi:GT2 family glycosyltransferase
MKLSVIIPAYNQLEAVLVCLNSLQAFHSKTVDTEFIVQDDASPNIALPMLIPPCSASVQRNEQNLGFPGNCNAGAARASGDVLFFVNQDIMAFTPLSKDWDIALMQAFEDSNVGIVGAKLLFPPNGNGELALQSAGGLFDGNKQPFHRWLGYTNHLLEEYNTPQEVSWTTGAALAIRAPLFREIGGMDTAYQGGYFEDVSLCCEVREHGFKVWYAPGVCFIHHVGTTGGNSHFLANAMHFKERWVDSQKVKSDVMVVKERFW